MDITTILKCLSKMKCVYTFLRAVIRRPLEMALMHILVFRRLALSCFLEQGAVQLSNRRLSSFGLLESLRRGLGFCFLYGSHDLRRCLAKEHTESEPMISKPSDL